VLPEHPKGALDISINSMKTMSYLET